MSLEWVAGALVLLLTVIGASWWRIMRSGRIKEQRDQAERDRDEAVDLAEKRAQPPPSRRQRRRAALRELERRRRMREKP